MDLGAAAFLQSRPVCNLGTLVDVHLAAVARSAFVKVHLVYQLYQFLNWEALQTVTHTLVGLTTGLLQCTLCGTGLEDLPQATAGSTSTGMSCNRLLSVCPCITIATQAAMVSSWVPNAIPDAVYYYYL